MQIDPTRYPKLAAKMEQNRKEVESLDEQLESDDNAERNAHQNVAAGVARLEAAAAGSPVLDPQLREELAALQDQVEVIQSQLEETGQNLDAIAVEHGRPTLAEIEAADDVDQDDADDQELYSDDDTDVA